MLKPAICYKEQLENALKEYFYTDDMMFYQCCNDSYLLEISDKFDNGCYQYAVIGNDDNLIGYISYCIDYYSSCAYNFCVFSFDRGNVIMGKELFSLLEKLIKTFHRVEFKAVSGNPAIRGYDNFLKRHLSIGIKHTFKDEFRDVNGNFHDTYLYEFINQTKKGVN